MKIIRGRLNSMRNATRVWVQEKYMQLALFNTIILILVLLRSAGYFEPYFPITINLTVFTGILLSVALLGARSREVFVIVLFFWLFAALLRVLGIDIWAERAGIYTYQALVVGAALLLFESMKKRFAKEKPKK